MDVLKEVKKAEEEALKIEKDYKEKIDALLSSLNEKSEKLKDELKKDMKNQLQAFQAELDTQFDEEKSKILKNNELEQKNIEESVLKNKEKVINELIEKLV
ncbi:MAG: hypothetical protein DRP57_00260 [Spirochaetes bacterium]|nr:MAG: hypothetical protein DRP57_00260 [Spirochaetota bacterium]